MVHCRSWELQQVCPWGGISAGGDLAETQEFGEWSRARLELSECCSKGCSSIPRAAEGSVCPAQPRTPQLLHLPTGMETTQTAKWWSWRLSGVFAPFSKSIRWVELFQRILPNKPSLETPWKQKAIPLLSPLCCGWAPAPGWCLPRSSNTTKWGTLQKAPAIYSV